MKHPVSSLYQSGSAATIAAFEEAFDRGLSQRRTGTPVPVFFRADDIGVPSAAFSRLLAGFARVGLPLNPALVPNWLTSRRWHAFSADCDRSSSLWCWHQHGWRHVNHEPAGKKCEFGPSRTAAAVRADLIRGRDRLRRILGPQFAPFFTPPWNRCTETTIEHLGALGFRGVSMNRPAPVTAVRLADLYVNVDLHTRKETAADDCRSALAAEIEAAVRSGRVGFMIHHQRMNETAFAVLEGLLDIVSRAPMLAALRFDELP